MPGTNKCPEQTYPETLISRNKQTPEQTIAGTNKSTTLPGWKDRHCVRLCGEDFSFYIYPGFKKNN